MPGDEVAASCRDLVQVYGSASGPVHALRGISVDIRARAVTVVVGPSGAGKSTFLRLVSCLEPPTVGDVVIAGESTSHLGRRARRRLMARRIGYVFQSPPDNLLDYLSVAEHVRLAWRMRAPDVPPRVDEPLEVTGLRDAADLRPDDLSAGEQQRLAFAMAIAAHPTLVIADEPTASLDPAGAKALADVLPALVDHGQTLLICTHDPAIIGGAGRVLAIENGTLAAEARDGGEMLAVVDDAGRIHLPREVAGLFPTQRARLSARDGHVRIERP